MAKSVRSGDGHRSFVLTKEYRDRVLVELHSERLTLRGLRWDDRDDFVATIDDEVLHWQGFPPAFARFAYDQFASAVAAQWRHWPMYLAVCDRETGAFLGVFIYSGRIGTIRSRVGLGWWLGPDARGRGLGTESLLLALEYGHTHLNVRDVQMGTAVDNVRARAQIARTGAEVTGRRPHQLPDGRTVDSIWFRHRLA